MIERQIVQSIHRLKDKFPVLAVTGPRQSGKSTLLKKIFPTYRYISLEDPDNREFAESDPKGFLKLYSEQVILDEIQRIPNLFSYIQSKVDESKIMGQYILSGSQNFHLVEKITQSLAGRVALFKLLPLDFKELAHHQLLPSRYIDLMLKGFYPAMYDRQIDPTDFYSNYIQTYVQRDISQLINIQDLNLFKTFIQLCAGRSGQILNLSALANECGISQPTVKSWLSILESSFIIFQLQPYFQNFNKRVIKTAKLYFYDTGLLCFLLRIRDAHALMTSDYKGALFENMIIAEFQKQNYHNYLHQDFYFWRDSNGNEVDLLIPNESGFDIFEIKASETILKQQFKGLEYLENIAQGSVTKKTLIYGGEESQIRTNYSINAWHDLQN